MFFKRLAGPALIFALACLLVPVFAAGSGGDLNLWVNVTNADTVGVEVNMGGVPHTRCSAKVKKGRATDELPPVWTKDKGGARWTWLVAGNVGPGKWIFSVRCWGHGRVRHAHHVFRTNGGIGPKSRKLWIPGSMHALSVVQSADPKGNGGGGTGPLYPVGQCTWWVAEHRPDLPLFKGRSGDALNWAKTAAADGFPVGEIPTVGAVAVFQPNQYGAGRYGHVALVTAVRGNRMTISESNFRGRSVQGTRTIPWSGLQFIYRKKPLASSSSLQLLSPAQNSILQGIVPVAASSGAEAVRFETYFYADPSKRASGQWVTIGTDNTPADGFTVNWDTTAIPNQGGPGGSSVVVAARALDSNGDPTATSSVRVDIANARNFGGQVFYPYYVVGTCEEGKCGLSLQTGPGYSGYSALGIKFDGEEVDVVCQAHGETYTSASSGESTDIWDRLLGEEWVSDYFVDTASKGVPSPPLPLCS